MYPPFTPSFLFINRSSEFPIDNDPLNNPLICRQFGGSSAGGRPLPAPPTWQSINQPDDDFVENDGDDVIDGDESYDETSLSTTTMAASASFYSRWFPVPIDTYNGFRLAVEVGLVTSLCLFGFIGNALTIMTLKLDSRDRKRTTNWLLQVCFLRRLNFNKNI